MDRIVATKPHRRAPAPDPTTALFDDHGRLLSASVGFIALLERQYLVEEIMALPRALALRSACGASARTAAAPAATCRFGHGGVVYRIDARYLATATAQGALRITVDEERPDDTRRPCTTRRRTATRPAPLRGRPRTRPVA